MADVPSNLIPTRITQLPDAPVASPDGLLLFVYEGNTYKVRAGDLLNVAGVPTSRQVTAGTGMTGGGQLTSNVTLSIAQKGVNSSLLSDTGVAQGVYGTATSIPVFTVDSTGRIVSASSIAVQVSGYVPVTRQVVAGNGLTGGGALNANITLTANLSSTVPLVSFQTGAAGTLTSLARGDHRHPAVDLSADDQVDNLLGLSNGGTARSLVMQPGAVIWSGSDGLYVSPAGAAGQVLVSGGAGSPSWGSAVVLSDEPANVMFAGPASGPDGPSSFRRFVNADLPASGVTGDTYGSSLSIPVFTVDSKGLITSASSVLFNTGLSYQGTWNASTNTPALVSSTGTNGYYYVVSVDGTTNLDGVTDWKAGDWAIFNGASWQKLDQTNLVSSVNGQLGAVNLGYADLSGAIPIWNQNTTGTAAGLSATLSIGFGGTGQTTAQAAINSLAGSVASGSYLRGNGANAVMSAIQAGDVPTLNQNTTGTASNVTGVVAIAKGGSGQTTAAAAFNALSPVTATGDLILGNGVNSATRLAIGLNGYLLTSNGTTASWVAAPASGVTSFSAGTTGFSPTTGAGGNVTLSGTLGLANGGSGQTTAQLALNSFAASVTSGSYLRGNGTNVVMSAIQAGDVPTLNQNTTGTASNVTSVVAIVNGGTNSTSAATAGGSAYGTGTAYAFTAVGVSGQVLTSNGAAAPGWSNLSGGTF